MRHNKISLEKMVGNIEDNWYGVTEFDGQRGFVWNELDIANLGDSIIRGISISSIITMPYDCNYQYSPDATPLEVGDDSNIETDWQIEEYIVDGQQRITSIAKLFLNTDRDSLYYFDLLDILYGFFWFELPYRDERDFWGERQEDVITTSYFESEYKVAPISEVFCKKFSRKSKPSSRFVLASDVLTDKHSSQVNMYLTELFKIGAIRHLDFDECNDYLTTTLCNVKRYTINHTQIKSESSLDFISRTFKKLNSSVSSSTN